MLPVHYSSFEVFLSKIGMHVKTVQIEFFAIEIVIRLHISNFKKSFAKMWKLTEKNPDFTYWKSVFLD